MIWQKLSDLITNSLKVFVSVFSTYDAASLCVYLRTHVRNFTQAIEELHVKFIAIQM